MSNGERLESYASTLINPPAHGPIAPSHVRKLVIGLLKGSNKQDPNIFNPSLSDLPTDFYNQASEMGWLVFDQEKGTAVITGFGKKVALLSLKILNPSD